MNLSIIWIFPKSPNTLPYSKVEFLKTFFLTIGRPKVLQMPNVPGPIVKEHFILGYHTFFIHM
jgi:hypothetical protein